MIRSRQFNSVSNVGGLGSTLSKDETDNKKDAVSMWFAACLPTTITMSYGAVKRDLDNYNEETQHQLQPRHTVLYFKDA